MTFTRTLAVRLAVLALLVTPFTSTVANAADQVAAISSHTAQVQGVSLHYSISGHGPAVVLLHGYAETARMWTPLIPSLAKRFTVIVPDLPGIGESSVPTDGLDMQTAAKRIHALVQSLHVDKASIVGHDIGLMVAYAYAAQFPAETTKLVVMDAFLPGVEGWEPVYNNPALWHFRFNGPTAEALVKGREHIYFEHYWNDFAADKTKSIPEVDRQAYTQSYARPGRIHASWTYFISFPQTALDFAQLAKTKLTMPVLSIAGEKSLGEVLGNQMNLVATDVKVVVIPNAGHWIMEEKPKETMDALLGFL
jgi:pimeloyl-ACP methyl ester carboxylesterase